MRVRLLVCLSLLFTPNVAFAGDVAPAPGPISRTELLAASVTPPKTVGGLRSQEVTLATGVRAPRHLHPCPTVGVVQEGMITFQIEGQPVQTLAAGQAFYEPADTPIARFDNEGLRAAKFTVFYLLGEGESETIRLLGK